MIGIFEEENSWDTIKNANLPVVLYGMGNGADMIIDVFEKFGIKYDDIFASDKFVRGHSFHEKKVLKLSEVEEKYDDFVVVMTFAIHDDESIENVKNISKRHLVLSPTVPVAGNGLFTKEFVEENLDKFEKVYSLLADEKSKKAFENVVKFKISGKLQYLFDVYSDEDEVFQNIIKLGENETILDLGAYDGDTVKTFTQVTNNTYKKIVALEPDKKNFKKLQKNTEELENVEILNKGIWNESTVLYFEKSAGRQSKITGSGKEKIDVVSVDSLDENFSFIKMDVEGSEEKALLGAENTIKENHPKLYVCAYHRNEDLFKLPLLVLNYDETYKLYFRQHKYIPAWECNFYII